MIEEIGKVRLDYSKYPGEDFYCDGEVEDELLKIVQSTQPSEFGRVIQERKKWPVLYHLSPLRENIVSWLPIGKKDKVLEVGSGCGAITGALSKKAGEVTCVDLSKKRSLINAWRHQECDNVTIHVGNFKDIEPELPSDYDFICLIGVFEYGQSYIGGDTPYEDFLKLLLPHLKPDGRIVIAIENKYGLKYFAGCKEDHLGTFFSGIENYEVGGGVRTFGREKLCEIFKSCGVEESHFYYPYPDYKFMTTLYSDRYLPGKGDLSNNLRNFDRDRMLLFDEKNAFDGILEEKLFPVFSNSYLVVLGKEPETVYAKYSNDRAGKFAIRTQIERPREGLVVRKYPETKEAVAHIKSMEASYQKLVKRFAGSGLFVTPCKLKEQGGETYAEFNFVKGVPLSELMDTCLEKGELSQFYEYLKAYREKLSWKEEEAVTDFDLIFANILVDGTTWSLIDYEWTFDARMGAKELAYRALYCYELENEKRGQRYDRNQVFTLLGISEKEAAASREAEKRFQEYVTGSLHSMAQIREDIGQSVYEPVKELTRREALPGAGMVQIYEDLGDGYKEEQSYFIQNGFSRENEISLELSVEDKVRTLRVDPAMYPCMVRILEASFNGKAIDTSNTRQVVINGARLGKGAGMVFATNDPNLNFRLDKLHRQEKKNKLKLTLELVPLSMGMAQELAKGSEKKFFH